MINELDQASQVHISGRGGNRTDLTVKLHTLAEPTKQSNFENCVADVNIPVGEVFTSRSLLGQTGFCMSAASISGNFSSKIWKSGLKMVSLSPIPAKTLRRKRKIRR